jgi:hypothetical protein
MAGPNHNDNWRFIVMATQFKLVGTQAVKVLARLAARNVVKRQLQGQGARLSHVRHAEMLARASEYLDQHPELYAQALERAQREGMIENPSVCTSRSAVAGTEKTSRI